MFSLGAWLALEVTTSTPDALCPPLDEAREAIAARVGEVLGNYRIDYALVRGEDAGRALKLEVQLDGQPVLQRELPLNHSGCEDAAQTIALVLERYFDAIERPQPPLAAPEREPVPETVERRVSQTSTPSPKSGPASSHPPSSRHRSWRAAAGLLIAQDLGLAPTLGLELRPAWLQQARRVQLGWGLALAPFVTSHTQGVREQEISERTLQIATWLPFELGFGSWSFWLGPWAQLRLQRAQAASLAEAQPGYRSLPGFGGGAGFGWSPTSSGLTLTLSGALGTQLVASSARFALRSADGAKTPVLVPQNRFSQVGISLALAF